MCKLPYMLYKKILHPFLILQIMCTTMIFGQFIEVNVDLDLRRLSEGDRQLFHSMTEDIKNYYINTQFSPEVTDLEMIIEFRLVLESVSRGGRQISINAQAILTNKLDQYYYAKGIQFPYSKGKKIVFSPSFDPLSSFLNYYAFMFIASELDTWDYMGGTPFFNRAVEQADMGKDSDWPRGWEDRWKKARKIKNNQYLRSMRFNYFLAQDELKSEKVNVEKIVEAMNVFYENLKDIDNTLGSNKETLKFLDAYHVNIAELMVTLKMEEGLKLLKRYDHDNKKIYEAYLKN